MLFSGKTFNLFIQFVHTENLKPVWNLYILFVLSYPCRGNGQCAKILKRLFKHWKIYKKCDRIVTRLCNEELGKF